MGARERLHALNESNFAYVCVYRYAYVFAGYSGVELWSIIYSYVIYRVGSEVLASDNVPGSNDPIRVIERNPR